MVEFSFDGFMQDVLKLFPDAVLGEDNDGQIVVYTGLQNVMINGQPYVLPLEKEK